MKKYILPILILLSGLSISISAALYSVIGLSKLFAGASLTVMIMAGSLEFSKLVAASLLYTYRKTIPSFLKYYLIMATVILMGITSIGIYGYLSSAYQEVANKDQNVDFQIELLENKKENFQSQLVLYTQEKTSIDEGVSSLRGGLSNNKIQYKDKQGNIINTTSSSTRTSLEKQLTQSFERQSQLNIKIDEINSEIFSLNSQVMDIKTNNGITSELGPLKYLAELTGMGMNQVINWLLLIIIFVFDPLAIALILAANFAFSQIKIKTNLQGEEIITPPTSTDPPLLKKKPKPEPPTITPKKVKEEEYIDPSLSGWRKNKIAREKSKKDDFSSGKTYN